MRLVASFGIDHGELVGLTPQQAFVLGAEFALFHSELRHAKKDELDYPCHHANVERLGKLAINQGWSVELVRNDDTWTTLWLTRRPKLSLVQGVGA